MWRMPGSGAGGRGWRGVAGRAARLYRRRARGAAVTAAAEAGTVVSRGARSVPGATDIRTNGRLAAVLLVLLALAPLPLGGNRPVVVAAMSLCVFAVGAWYGVRLGWRRHKLRIGLADLWLPGLLLVGLLAYAVAQVLPLGPLVRETPAGPVTSATISLAPGATGALALQFMAYGVFALLMMQAGAREHRGVVVLDWIFGVIAAYAALGLFMFLQMGDTFFGIEKTYYQGSLTGTFINRNSNATFLASGWRRERDADGVARAARAAAQPAAGGDRRGARSHRHRAARHQFADGDRGGMAGAAVALLAGAIKARFAWWKWAGLIALMAVGAAWMAPEFGAVALDRFLELDSSLGSRMALYQQVVTMIASDPLRGFGGGSFEWVFPLFHQPPLSADVVWDRAHNTYLGLWSVRADRRLGAAADRRGVGRAVGGRVRRQRDGLGSAARGDCGGDGGGAPFARRFQPRNAGQCLFPAGGRGDRGGVAAVDGRAERTVNRLVNLDSGMGGIEPVGGNGDEFDIRAGAVAAAVQADRGDGVPRPRGGRAAIVVMKPLYSATALIRRSSRKNLLDPEIQSQSGSSDEARVESEVELVKSETTLPRHRRSRPHRGCRVRRAARLPRHPDVVPAYRAADAADRRRRAAGRSPTCATRCRCSAGG